MTDIWQVSDKGTFVFVVYNAIVDRYVVVVNTFWKDNVIV